jgi:hypothetical protein
MMRVLLLVGILGACGGDKPPPDPICDKVMSTYDKVAAAVNVLMDTKVPHGSPAMYCAKLELAVRGASALVGDEMQKQLKPVMDKLDAAAGTCIINGIASTQETVKKDLAQLRTRVAVECAK